MKKWLIVFLTLVTTVMCSMTTVLTAYAAELAGVSVPVTVSLSGTLAYPEENFRVVLKADDADCPMPNGTENGAYSIIITGEDTESFPAITYDRVGVYTYTVYQVAGTNKKCTYDDTVYTLTVTISNKEDYSDLEAAAVLCSDSEGKKLPGVKFENEYQVETPSGSPKTGDESTPLLYAALIVISAGMIIHIICKYVKNSKNQKE